MNKPDDMELNFDFDETLVARKSAKKEVFTEDCGNSLHFDRVAQSPLQNEFLLLTLLLQ
jgi:hypothetical protein